MFDLTSLQTIESFLKKYNLAPNKFLGQNFLIDKDVLDKIIETADSEAGDNVIEIGPGLGTLTQALCAKGANILAIEKDRDLIPVLEDSLRECKNLKILNEDFLQINFEKINLVFGGGPYKIVSNIPYYITSPAIRKIFSFPVKPTGIVFLVQREVAERISAPAGEMSLISLYVQFYAAPEVVGIVKPSSFFPQPKVESAILKITIGKKVELPEEETKKLWRLAKMGFSSRRKTLANNLAAGLHRETAEMREFLKNAGFNEKARAQELGVEEWKRLLEIICDFK